MPSANFTFDDAIQAVRHQLNDDAQRRWTDSDINTFILPRVYQQLVADRPDLFVGLGIGVSTGLNLKPAQMDPIPFDDSGFTAFVEALLAATREKDEEASSARKAAEADARSQRAKRS